MIDSKTNNDILSYKSELASDKKFQKILNHYLKCSQYKELKKNEESLFNISLLLFIIYCSKKDFSQVDEIEDNTEENTVFIKQNFNKIYKTYEFTDEDYMGMHQHSSIHRKNLVKIV